MNQSVGLENKAQLVIDEDTVFYVVAPAKTATGGPELLHQLAYHLRTDLGYKAHMYYMPPHVKDPVHPAYASYENPFIKTINDDEKNVLIVPEVIWGVKTLERFSNIQKGIWWLSVNNFMIPYVLSNSPYMIPIRIVNKISRHLLGRNTIDVREVITKNTLNNKVLIRKAFQELGIEKVNLHLCQSYYAMEFLTSLSINNVAYLSDYLNKEFLTRSFEPSLKQDIVVFNPTKGASFTRRIMAKAPEVDFIAIENMNRREVIELLRKAKVYIDFGDHPGKDRIPREAAVLGCCVIVGKRGSAANDHDVPIPNNYKFEVEEKLIPQIVKTIKHCLTNYEEVYHDFDKYREIIKKEPERFLRDVNAIFGAPGRDEMAFNGKS